MINLYSQTKTIDLKPEGMEFVPQGQFNASMIEGSEILTNANVSVEAFYMSNEITNAEFREFVDWAKKNPDEKLYQVRYSQEIFSDPDKGITKDTVIRKVNTIEVSKFSSEMIDPLCFEKVNTKYKGYFSNKKYNDYPVVGVSFRIAEYFCLWKTMMENEQMNDKGLPNIQSYRIPLEAEWEYVARQPIINGIKNGLVQKVNKGNSNEWGLFHLDDNVSEWVTAGRVKAGIVRGGSWKSENSIYERHLINPDSKEPYIGFRIVRSYLTVTK